MHLSFKNKTFGTVILAKIRSYSNFCSLNLNLTLVITYSNTIANFMVAKYRKTAILKLWAKTNARFRFSYPKLRYKQIFVNITIQKAFFLKFTELCNGHRRGQPSTRYGSIGRSRGAYTTAVPIKLWLLHYSGGLNSKPTPPPPHPIVFF